MGLIRRILIVLLAVPFQAIICQVPLAHGTGVVINVPSQQLTIQAGIDAASSGDIVRVASGTYTGSGNKDLDFKGKAITVKSQDGALSCIIDCQNSGRGVFFHNGEGANSRLDGFTIKNGNVSDFGGGISIKFSSPQIINCIIEYNSASNSGGVHCKNSNATFSLSIIRYNHATGLGGGVGGYDSSPTIKDTSIIYNDTDTRGGGLYFTKSAPAISNCIISYNTSHLTGAGVLLDEFSSGTIRDSLINSNKLNHVPSGSSGGGICLVKSSTRISDCSIMNNESNISFAGPPGIVTNSGGVSFRENSNGIIEDSIISGNKAQERAGIGCWNASPTILRCTIESNIANVQGGGGVGFYSGSNGRLINTIIRNNSSVKAGGGINVWEASPSIINTLVYGNFSSQASGGINIYGTDSNNSMVTNCTIANNISEEKSGALYSNFSTPTISNTIIWGNNPAVVTLRNGVPTVQYSNFQVLNGQFWGSNNISSDPRIVGDDNYRLKKGSPCIDAGTNSAPELLTTDLDGRARVYIPSGRAQGIVDMGAYESQYSRMKSTLSWILLLME